MKLLIEVTRISVSLWSVSATSWLREKVRKIRNKPDTFLDIVYSDKDKELLALTILKYEQVLHICQHLGETLSIADLIVFVLHTAGDSCPLCLYYSAECHRCPIGRIGFIDCHPTPWSKIRDSVGLRNVIKRIEEEIRFLQGITKTNIDLCDCGNQKSEGAVMCAECITQKKYELSLEE